MKHQGIVVAGGRPGNIPGSRSKHLNLRAAERKVVPCGHGFDGNAEAVGLVQKSLIGRDARVAAYPQHPGTKITQDRKHSPHVIAVRVGQGDGIETADIAATIIRGTPRLPRFQS